MEENATEPEFAQPSMDELRRMLEAKALAKEEERKRLSRRTSLFLVVGALVAVVVILCFPKKQKSVGSAAGLDPDLAAKAAQIQQLSNPPGGDAGPPGEGTVQGESGQGDLEFAKDLIQFMQTGAPKTAPAPASSAPPPDRKAAGDR